jgi:hypothetical protein
MSACRIALPKSDGRAARQPRCVMITAHHPGQRSGAVHSGDAGAHSARSRKLRTEGHVAPSRSLGRCCAVVRRAVRAVGPGEQSLGSERARVCMCMPVCACMHACMHVCGPVDARLNARATNVDHACVRAVALQARECRRRRRRHRRRQPWEVRHHRRRRQWTRSRHPWIRAVQICSRTSNRAASSKRQ